MHLGTDWGKKQKKNVLICGFNMYACLLELGFYVMNLHKIVQNTETGETNVQNISKYEICAGRSIHPITVKLE